MRKSPISSQLAAGSFPGKNDINFKSEILCQCNVVVCHQFVKTNFNYIQLDYCNK